MGVIDQHRATPCVNKQNVLKALKGRNKKGLGNPRFNKDQITQQSCKGLNKIEMGVAHRNYKFRK